MDEKLHKLEPLREHQGVETYTPYWVRTQRPLNRRLNGLGHLTIVQQETMGHHETFRLLVNKETELLGLIHDPLVPFCILLAGYLKARMVTGPTSLGIYGFFLPSRCQWGLATLFQARQVFHISTSNTQDILAYTYTYIYTYHSTHLVFSSLNLDLIHLLVIYSSLFPLLSDLVVSYFLIITTLTKSTKA